MIDAPFFSTTNLRHPIVIFFELQDDVRRAVGNGGSGRGASLLIGRLPWSFTGVASPTKKNLKCRFSGQIHDWKHLYLRFFAYDVP